MAGMRVSARDPLRLALRFALREMRGGLSGFLIFLTCIALGVAAIGGVGSVARAISSGVAAEGQALLGGDIRFELNQREATPPEFAFLDSLGTLAVSAGMRSMARLEDGSDQALVEAKAVDGAYPLFGSLATEPALPRSDLFAARDGIYGAAAPDLLFARLGLAPGDRIRLGSATFELRAKLSSEPDAISDGFGFAPRLLLSLEGLRASGLIQPGSLVEHVYKIRLPDGTSEARLAALRAEAAEKFPEAGWSIRTRANAAPALSSNIERFSQFLTLVGLTALVVGGVGVANAVSAYLDGKRGVIATFKSLGASGGFVFTLYLVQILIIASVGIGVGLGLAVLMPFAAGAALSQFIPVPAAGGIYPGALALAAVFGVLVTLAFAVLPLGRARAVPATALFREMGMGGHGLPHWTYVAFALGIAALLAALAVWSAADRRIAAIFVGAAIFAFIVLRACRSRRCRGWRARRRACARRRCGWRIGNIHRPGALTSSVVLSLGLGLTLLVTLALIDGDLRRQISGTLPERAPNFFFVDIQAADVDAFAGLVGDVAPNGNLMRVPMLRGRIMALNGIDVQKVTVPPEGAWVLRGDRGITYSATVPDNATLGAGTWWPADYSGRTAGLLFGGGGRTARPEARRHGHGQRARPQHHRPDRQSARGAVGIDGHQLRHGVLAQHLRRRAACLAGHADIGQRHSRARGGYPQSRDPRLSGRHDGAGQGRARHRQSAGRPTRAPRFAPSPASHCWHRFSCSPARSRPATGRASTMPSC